MTFDFNRLRRGEWILGAGGLLLAISLFFFKWYGVSARLDDLTLSLSANGWHSHTILRWFMLVTILAALALFVATLTQATPAIPSALAPVVTAIAFVTTILVAYRVVINEPGPNALIEVRVGAWIGLLAAALVTYGGYLAMRMEGGPLADVTPRRRRLVEPSRADVEH
jgi:hypothetical protein